MYLKRPPQFLSSIAPYRQPLLLFDPCPAQSEGHVSIDTTRSHAACYAAYATGDVGANFTQILGQCCNATGNVSAPVVTVHDQSRSGCWLTCNATWIESQGQPDYGMAFWSLEDCIRQQAGFTNTSDQIFCYPKNDVRAGCYVRRDLQRWDSECWLSLASCCSRVEPETMRSSSRLKKGV